MKRSVATMLLAAAMAITTLSGCGKSTESSTSTPSTEKNTTKAGGASETKQVAEAPGEVQELVFWGWWSSEARKPYIEEMVTGFNESQDKYRVTYVDIPFGDIFTKNIAQIAAGDPCDIMANSMEEVKFRASQSQVENMDAYLTQEDKGAFYPQYMEACTGEDGSVYGLPLSVDTRAVYYNKAHFEEAGIKPEEIQTWDDLVAAAHKLDVKNGDRWERIGFMPILGNGGMDSLVINANNGQGWFDPETLEAKVDTETNREVLTWVREQIDYYGQSTYDEISAVFESGMQDPFASGSLSMLVQTSAYKSSLKQNAPDLAYGVIQMPEFKKGTGHMINGGGFVLEIPKGAKCPEGSAEFIKYVASKETQDFLSVNIGDFSARKDFDKDSVFFQDPVNVDLAKCLESTATLIVPNELKGYQDVIKPLVDEGVLGMKEPDKALADAQKAFEDFIASN